MLLGSEYWLFLKFWMIQTMNWSQGHWFNEFKVEYVVFFPFLLLLNNNDKFLDDDGPKICFTPQTFELSKKYGFS
jgi:hypothetical protein